MVLCVFSRLNLCLVLMYTENNTEHPLRIKKWVLRAYSQFNRMFQRVDFERI
jgi:hypothetical protein